MKKQYMKPVMKVYSLRQQPQLLAGSNYPPDWDGPVGYTPGIADDKNQLPRKRLLILLQ